MKTCSRCNEELPLDMFHRNRQSPDGRVSACKNCRKADAVRDYDARRDSVKEATKRNAAVRRQEAREKLLEYLDGRSCLDCGEADIVVLEFDHVRGTKEYEVPYMARKGYDWSRIQAEIDKCDVVCCNCHRRRTYSRIPNCYRTRYTDGRPNAATEVEESPGIQTAAVSEA